MSETDKKSAIEWYREGLSFECALCGNCCTGAPGFVWFNDEEAKVMADHMKMDVPDFLAKYAHKKFGRWSLNEFKNEKGEYDCVFLKDLGNGKRGCELYQSRPTQCKTWPFWPENLRSKKAWDEAASTCPGMCNKNGTFYPIEKIRVILDQNEF